jgi:cellulose synthase/poly-beta-1,6-N-acetylglucosamine synthase-like glycosyltransferase
MELAGFVLSVLALLALLPASVLCAQVLLALPAYRPRPAPAGRRPTLAVVVPAHDEAQNIGATLRSILPDLTAGDRLLVVADNCADDTAAAASAAGAEVIERSDPARRGKGFALDFGIRHLERNPPEAVVMVDADCEVQAGTIDRLVRTCGTTGRPVQALYLMRASAPAALKARVAEFAWIVRNHVRPLGYHRLGLPCQLMGSGMAFPWGVIGKARLASGELVEDLVLGIELACAGTPPLFCPEARVTSAFAASREGARTQRTRWEHGHLAAIFREAPRLFVQAIRHGNRELFALALDLCVPPLALLTALAIAMCGAGGVLAAAAGITLPLWLASASLVLLGSAVLGAWARYGRRVVSLGSLAYAPVYALSKLPLYFAYLAKRQVDWVRTRRGRQ